MRTEASFSTAFAITLSNGGWSIGLDPVRHIVEELSCRQGRPDYVGTRIDLSRINDELIAGLLELAQSPAAVNLLASMDRQVQVSRQTLVDRTGLSMRMVRRSLRVLEEIGFVMEQSRDSYGLLPRASEVDVELWAFEIKLSNWRRALYQALQYKAFAHRAFVVVPEDWSHRFEKRSALFSTHEIGLIALDTDTGKLRMITSSGYREPSSKDHHLYALSKFVSRAVPTRERNA